MVLHLARRCILPLLTLAIIPGTAMVVRSPEVQAQSEQERGSEYEAFALTHNGDAARGERLFQNSASTSCSACHQVKGQGGKVGPDLTSIGGKFERGHLIESLLEPSRQIVEGYRASVIVTLDGRVLTGIVKETTRGSVTIAGADGKLFAIRQDRVESREESNVSLMPQGLATLVSKEQFTDLVAYLETLRPGGKPSPGGGITGPISVPDGFRVEVVTTGISGGTALEILPDGRVLVCEQQGRVRVIERGKLLAEPFVTLPVDSSWERGAIGITIDPNFEQNHFVYLCWIAKDPFPHHRISRFTAKGNIADRASEKLLLQGDDQRRLGGKVPAGHQGGAIHFGPDRKLYVGIGEQTAELQAQQLGTLQGKILRLNADGTVPADNPFLKSTMGKYQTIWARGCRNPFTFAFNPAGGEMFINDVGGKFEEINRGLPGANYGWPIADHGPTSIAGVTGPLHIYPQASIAGGAFLDTRNSWPERLHGKYFFADFVHGWIKTLDPRNPEQAEDFVTGLRRPVDLRFAPDGSLYVLLRNAWVIDGKFVPGTGSLLRIAPRL